MVDVARAESTARDVAGRTGPLTLGFLAAPELPAAIARELAAQLPGLLPRRARGAAWSVRIVCDPLTGGEHDNTQMLELTHARMRQDGWDLAVCLTDLPLRAGGRPVVADTSTARQVALLSLPALGALLLHRRARMAIVRLVDELLGDDATPGRMGADPARLLGRRIVLPDAGIDARFVAPVVSGHVRLVAGMVRANNPWRLVAGLSKALVAALGTAALMTLNPMIWQLGNRLGAARLTVLAVGSLAVLVGWLIVSHGLWEQPVAREARYRATLYNVVTVLTLSLGVLCLYGVLLMLSLVTAAFIIDPALLGATLKHPVGVGAYVYLAWMATSVAMVGGALGAGLESNEAVRAAAYGYRQRRRTAPDAPSTSRGGGNEGSA